MWYYKNRTIKLSKLMENSNSYIIPENMTIEDVLMDVSIFTILPSVVRNKYNMYHYLKNLICIYHNYHFS